MDEFVWLLLCIIFVFFLIYFVLDQKVAESVKPLMQREDLLFPDVLRDLNFRNFYSWTEIGVVDVVMIMVAVDAMVMAVLVE